MAAQEFDTYVTNVQQRLQSVRKKTAEEARILTDRNTWIILDCIGGNVSVEHCTKVLLNADAKRLGNS